MIFPEIGRELPYPYLLPLENTQHWQMHTGQTKGWLLTGGNSLILLTNTSTLDAFRRVRGLCRLFAAGIPGLRVPNCLGYCIDEGDVGLGYVFEATDSALAPKSLYELFKVASKHRPELYDRFNMAVALAESVLGLHNAQ